MSTQLRNVLAVAVLATLIAGCTTETPPVVIYNVMPGATQTIITQPGSQMGTNVYFGQQSVTYSLVLGAPPTIIAQPASRIKERGTYVDFTVFATNLSAPLTYQWYRNDIDIPGATNMTYYIAAVEMTNVASYTCAVTGSGTTLSEPAYLSVYYLYYTNSVAGVMDAPIGTFKAPPGGTIQIGGAGAPNSFNRVSSNYFSFYGPYVPQASQFGPFQNTTSRPKLTVDTYDLANDTVDTAIRVWQEFSPYGWYENNNVTPPWNVSQPKLSRVGPIILSTDPDPTKSVYSATVYYKNGTIGGTTVIRFNWLYHD